MPGGRCRTPSTARRTTTSSSATWRLRAGCFCSWVSDRGRSRSTTRAKNAARTERSSRIRGRSKDVFQFQSVGIGEENGVIARTVSGILRGRIENGGADAKQQGMEAIDVGTILGLPCDMMQSRRIAIVTARSAFSFRAHDADRTESPGSVQIEVESPLMRVRKPIAHEAENVLVESARGGRIAHRQIDMVKSSAYRQSGHPCA